MSKPIADLIHNIDGPLLWLDSWAYAEKLFLKEDKIPWLDPNAFEDFFRKSLGLLDPSVASIDVDRVIDAWLEGNKSLKTAMVKRPRTSYPIKTLLANDGLRLLFGKLLEVIRDARGGKPLALSVSSPLSLLCRLYEVAHGKKIPEVTDDDCERAAVYLADFFGQFGKANVSLIMVVDWEEDAAAGNYQFAMEPIDNVAKHLRWKTVLATNSLLDDDKGFDWTFSPTRTEAVRGDWDQDLFNSKDCQPLGESGSLYANIPADAVPEKVLEVLNTLRKR